MAVPHFEILTNVVRGRWSRAQCALAHPISEPVMEAMIATLSAPAPSPTTAHEA